MRYTNRLKLDKWNRIETKLRNIVKRSTMPAMGSFKYDWITFGSGYFMPAFGHWDVVHISLDLLHYNLIEAEHQILNYLSLMRNDGMFPIMVKYNIKKGILESVFTCSSPPLWYIPAWEIYCKTKNKDFLRIIYNSTKKNIRYWEGNRQLKEGFFWYADTVENGGWESGYDVSPRFDMRSREHFASIDLSCQMKIYYDYASLVAKESGDKGLADIYKNRAEKLSNNIKEYMWDEKTKFFYDLEIRGNKWRKIKTTASFWTLVSKIATKEQAKSLVKHLTNEREFWTTFPIPSVAANESNFELDMWRGPVWISTNMWVAKGLLEYGYQDIVNILVKKTLNMVSRVFEIYGKIYEFYNPFSNDISKLLRKKDIKGPCSDYIGQNPLITLYHLQKNI